MLEKVTMLWEQEAPYTADSPDGFQPSLRHYPVAGAEKAVIVCAGGGYHTKADHEADPVAEKFQQEGIAGFVLDYRVAPCHYMAPLADAQRAIRIVRSLGYRMVGILGFSAGGNLVCNAATHFDGGNPEAGDPMERISCRPDFFVPCYPVVSFMQYPHYGSTFQLLQDRVNEHALQRYFSAELNVTRETPPAFIWHTADDSCVPVENSLLLAGALSRCGVTFELRIYPHGPHGVGLGEDLPVVREWFGDCVRFIWDLKK